MKEEKALGGDLSVYQQIFASCSGALLTSFFVTPLDVVKIRLQAQRKPQAFSKGHCYLYCNGLMDHMCICLNENGGKSPQITARNKQWYKRPGNFNGTMDAFRKIITNEGLASLWSGLPPTLVMAVPSTAVYFTTYEQLKAVLGHENTNISQNWWKPVVAGGSSRVFAVTVISPLEMVRTKLQSEQLSYRQVTIAVKKTIQSLGVLSMWKGLGPTLMRDVPFSSIYWCGYEMMKTKAMLERGSTRLPFVETFLFGAISGTIAGVLTLPFDVIKTHRQMELGHVIFAHVPGKEEVTSTFRLIQNLYREHGIRALFSGLTPRIVKVAPACAVMITSFEFFKSFFQSRNIEKLKRS